MEPILEEVFGNGVRLETGGYGFPPLNEQIFTKMVAKMDLDEGEYRELKIWLQATQEGHFGIEVASDPCKLEESGWGVIFAHDCDPAIRKALEPLLDWRKEQARAKYWEYDGANGYRPNDTRSAWLARPPRRHGLGTVDTDRMPYYLMIVGDPETISFSFQEQLDVQFAVGRICFDTPAEYAIYAKSVVRAEKKGLVLPRKVSFFGPQNRDDRSTELSMRNLVTPLANRFISECQPEGKGGWTVSTYTGDVATKDTLREILCSKEAPALLFTASHGLEVHRSNPDQRKLQGALVCQNWPGSKRWRGGQLPEDFFFSAADLGDDSDVFGRLAFFFACFSAGTPNRNEFIERIYPGSGQIAEKPFIARLPQRMLSHPAGGALAVIGHVDRAWGYSFYQVDIGPQLQDFQDTFYKLLDGYPIGTAFEGFNERYATISTEITDLQHDMEFGFVPDPGKVPVLWTANNDAKNYVILGDPAVRLMV